VPRRCAALPRKTTSRRDRQRAVESGDAGGCGRRRMGPVGFANSGGLVFVDASAEQVAGGAGDRRELQHGSGAQKAMLERLGLNQAEQRV
jgi:hypothetical protein